jgi:hypothetical protein
MIRDYENTQFRHLDEFRKEIFPENNTMAEARRQIGDGFHFR